MKIAVSGKGGVGKTTIVALMARILRDSGKKVIVIDADPDMNLATILGIPKDLKITPIIDLKELIADRTETEVGKSAPFFKLNPRVDDIPEKYWIEYKGIKLLVMGTVQKGGGGCACPENTFLKTLLSHLLINREEWVLLDMEAGIEHLGRGTAIGVDEMIVVVEPSVASIDTANRIKKLAKDIKINKLRIIGNKVETLDEKNFIIENTKSIDKIGFINNLFEIKEINTKKTSALNITGKPIDQIKQVLKSAGWIE